MLDQVLLHDLLSEAKYLWIPGIDDCPNPMRIGEAKGLHPREVFNDSTACGTDQRFVDAKDVSISMHVDHRLAERHSLLFQRSQEFVEAGCSSRFGCFEPQARQQVPPLQARRPGVFKPWI